MNDTLADLLFPNIDKSPDYYEMKYPKRKIGKDTMVTRFAPSPTGFVHMGSLYVSFLNRVLSNQTNGIFYLRIEDTDQKREVEDGINKIMEALDYFDIKVDESITEGGGYGPYIQTERKEIYQTYIKDMIRKGLAYPCFCTPEKLEEIRETQTNLKIRTGYYGKWATCRNMDFDEIRKHLDNHESYVIRLKAPEVVDEKIECADMIKGNVYFPANDIDVVLLKSDGLPTYHFAHIIDDHLMHTTHVIRGDEWLSSLPLHLQLFSFLGFEAPKYAHISPLTKKEGNSVRKLSKRKDPECAISYYQELGIPVDGLKLYFATITNSNFEEWYDKNKNSSIKDFNFSFDKMPVGGTLFDIDKLLNICKLYFSLKTNYELYDEALSYYKDHDKEFYNILLNNKDYALEVLNIERNNIRARKDISCYKDIRKETWYMFDELFFNSVSYDETIKDKHYDTKVLDEYLDNYINLDDNDTWYSRVKELAESMGYAKDIKSYKENPDNYNGHVGDICEMIRVAITSRTQTPSLFEIQKILGKDRINKRILNFKKILSEKQL